MPTIDFSWESGPHHPPTPKRRKNLQKLFRVSCVRSLEKHFWQKFTCEREAKKNFVEGPNFWVEGRGKGRGKADFLKLSWLSGWKSIIPAEKSFQLGLNAAWVVANRALLRFKPCRNFTPLHLLAPRPLPSSVSLTPFCVASV